MTTPVNCPNCGSQLPPGAPACARCGERFDVEPEPPVAAAPAPHATPPAKPPSTKPTPSAASSGSSHASSGDAAKALQQYLADARERWGLDATPLFIGVFVLAGIAILIATIAHISYLNAGDLEGVKKANDAVWLTTAGALGSGALVIAVLVRFDAARAPVHADVQSIDFRVGIGLAGITVLLALVGAIVGMSGRFDPSDAWEHYAAVFSFFGATWFALSQPVPEKIGSTKATSIGLIVGIVALAILVVGQIMGIGDSNDSYVGGISWQAMAISIIVLDLGWFLGMQPRRR